VGGGDGRVKAVQGEDTQWDVLAENVLEAGVVSLSAAEDGRELVVGTKNGKLWRLLTTDLRGTLHSACHTGEVTDVCFGAESDAVCTVSDAGEMNFMDLSDYQTICCSIQKTPARSSCISSNRKEILVGYDDGFVRAWPAAKGGDTAAKLLWHIPNAHRGAVTSIKDSVNFMLTGGADFTVRMWHSTKHELLTQFTCHRRPVCEVLIDNVSPHIVHSGSDDKLVITYDLKQNKPLVQHVTQNSNVTGLSQRKDQEHEVVSANTDGRILFWDVDYPDPQGCLQVDHEVRFTCVDVSPSGRYIAAGADDTIMYIFDLNTCGCIQQCEGHSGPIVKVAWSPDQKQCVSVGKDCCVCIWNFFEA
jgi:WD40 repeat protein